MRGHHPTRHGRQQGRLRRAAARLGRAVARLGRLLAWATVLALCAAVAAFLVLRSRLTPETLRSGIQSQLERTFRRPVRVGHVSVLLHQGIKVSGLDIQESADFGGGTFLSSQFLVAKYKMLPLLYGRLELSEVSLVAPSIRLMRRSDGTWNVAGLAAPPANAAPDGGGFGLPPLQGADELSVQRGRLEIVDEKADFRVRIEDLRLEARDFRTSGYFPVRLSFSNDGQVRGSPVAASVRLEGEADLGDFRPRDAGLRAESLRLEVNGREIDVAGSVSNLEAPRLELTASMPALESPDLAPYLPVPAGLSLPAAEWRADVQVTPSTGSTPSEIRVRRLRIAAGDLQLSVSGRLSPDGRRARLSLGLPPFRLDRAARLYSGWEDRGLGGTAEAAARVSGDLRSPRWDRFTLKLRGASARFGSTRTVRDLDGSFISSDGGAAWEARVSRAGMDAYGSVLTGIEAEMRTSGPDLCVRKLDWTWNGSRMRFKGRVDGYRAWRKVWAEGRVDRLRVDEFYAAIEELIHRRREERGGRPPSPQEADLWARIFRNAVPERFPDLAGTLRIAQAHSPNTSLSSIDLDWDLSSLSQGLGEVDGSLAIRLGTGRVNNVPEVRAGHGLLNVLILPFSLMHEMQRKAVASFDTAVLRTLDVTKADGNFSFRDGEIDVRYIHFDSPQFVAYADGKADWPDEKINLRVLMRAATPRGRLPDRLVDTQGRPSLELFLKDDLNKPTPEMSLRKMRSDDIEQAVAEGLKRALPPPRIEHKLECARR